MAPVLTAFTFPLQTKWLRKSHFLLSCCSLWLWGRRKLSGMWKLLSPPLCCYSLRVRCNVSTQLFPSLHSYTITRPINQSVHVCVCVCAALWGCLVLLDQKLKATWVFLCLSSVLTSLLCCTTKQGEQTSSITAWKPVWLFSRQKSCERTYFSHCFLSPSPSSLSDRASEQVSVLQLGVRLSELRGGRQLRRVDVQEEHKRWGGNYMWSQLGKSRRLFVSYQLHRPVGQRGLLVRVHRGSDDQQHRQHHCHW